MVEVVYFDAQRRFEITREILNGIEAEFTPGVTTHLWGVATANTRLQILPPNSELAKLKDEYEASTFSEEVASWDSAADPEDGLNTDAGLELALAGFYRITCRPRIRSKKIRLTLPADVVDVGLFRTGESVAVYSTGAILQVWRNDAWQRVTTVRDLQEFTRKVRAMLE